MNDAYLKTVINCYSLVPSCRRGLDEGLNSIFGHMFAKNYFAFSSLTLKAFTMLYVSYI